jgi:hypothetical protein
MPSKYLNVNSIHRIVRFGGFLLLMCTLFLSSVFAQKEASKAELEKDENGKFIHYEVVTGNHIQEDSLRLRALEFLKVKNVKGLNVNKDQVFGKGKFIISKTAFVLSHPSGEVVYDFEFGIKDNKYRFWLTNFKFIPYQRDRYANYVPSNSKGIPLETNIDKINSLEWNAYIDATADHAKAFASEFKQYLKQMPKAKSKVKVKPVISTKNW